MTFNPSLVKVPVKSLRNPCEPVAFPLDSETKEKLESLLELCVKYKGIGLAAPQVGWNIRAFAIMAWEKSEDGKNYRGAVLVNPEITWASEELHEVREGCLSIPMASFVLNRHKELKIKAYDLNGQLIERHLKGLSAQCAAHEVQHLQGVLVSDRKPLHIGEW